MVKSSYLELMKVLEIEVSNIEVVKRFITYITSNTKLEKLILECFLPPEIYLENVYPPNPSSYSKERIVWKVRMYPRFFENKIKYSFGIRIDCFLKLSRELIKDRVVIITPSNNDVSIDVNIKSDILKEYQLVIGPFTTRSESIEVKADYYAIQDWNISWNIKYPSVVLETNNGKVSALIKVKNLSPDIREVPMTIYIDNFPSYLIPFKVNIKGLKEYNVKVIEVNRAIIHLPDIPLRIEFI